MKRCSKEPFAHLRGVPAWSGFLAVALLPAAAWGILYSRSDFCAPHTPPGLDCASIKLALTIIITMGAFALIMLVWWKLFQLSGIRRIFEVHWPGLDDEVQIVGPLESVCRAVAGLLIVWLSVGAMALFVVSAAGGNTDWLKALYQWAVSPAPQSDVEPTDLTQIGKLKGEINVLGVTLQHSLGDINERIGKIAGALETLPKIQSSIAQAQDRVEKLAGDPVALADIQRSLAKLNEQDEKVAASVAALQSSVAQVKERAEKLAGDPAALAEVGRSLLQLKEQADTLAGGPAALADIQRSLANLNEQDKKVVAGVAALQGFVAQVKEQSEKLTGDPAALAEVGRSLLQLKEQVDTLAGGPAALADIQRSLANLNEQDKKVVGGVAALQGSVAQVKEQGEKLTGDPAALADIQRSLAKLNEQGEKVAPSVAALQSSVAQVKERAEKLTGDPAALADIQRSLAKLNDLRNSLQEVTKIVTVIAERLSPPPQPSEPCNISSTLPPDSDLDDVVAAAEKARKIQGLPENATYHVLAKRDFYFNTAEPALSPKGKDVLKQFINTAKTGNMALSVRGEADQEGTWERNELLSKARAALVARLIAAIPNAPAIVQLGWDVKNEFREMKPGGPSEPYNRIVRVELLKRCQ